MLGVQTVPHDSDGQKLLREVGKHFGVEDTFRRTPVAVYFGKPGTTVPDPYFGGEGPDRTGCTRCGACMVGCREGAKNTLVKNYLWFAEKRGVEIHPERAVVDIRPLGAADGADGYLVTTERPGAWFRKQRRTFTARGIVMSAGALGTNRLLARCKLAGSLPVISDRLGHLVRTNSESVLAVTMPEGESRPWNDVAISASMHPRADTHIEFVTYGRHGDAMSFLYTLLTGKGTRVTRPLMWLGNILRHPVTFLRTLWPFGWSRADPAAARHAEPGQCDLVPREARDSSAASRSPPSRTRRSRIRPSSRSATARPSGWPNAPGGYAQSMVLEAWANIPTTAHILGGAVIGRDASTGVVDAGEPAVRLPEFPRLRRVDGSRQPGRESLADHHRHDRACDEPGAAQGGHMRVRMSFALTLVVTLAGALSGTADAVAASGAAPDPAAAAIGHFHPKGTEPSKYTIQLQNGVRATLPFDDKRDFEEAKRGFIAAPPYRKIMADAGNVAWNIGSYDFLLQGKDFDSINPSLQRQAILNMAYGLYEVVPGKIYQVRGFDLANMTVIRGDTGWILFDVLTCKETARAALAFVNEKLGQRPVVAVVYSHSHGDHFGGIRGVVDEADVAQRQGADHRARGLHGGGSRGKRVRGQRDESPGVLPVRTAAAARPVRTRRPGHRQERCGRRAGPRGADADHRQGHRGSDHRRRHDGVPEHARHRGTRGDEHLVPAVQGVLGGGEHHRHDPQHLHVARRAGPRRARLVEADQPGAVHVRPGCAGDVLRAQLAALRQRPGPGSHACPARHLRQPEQRRAAPGEPGRDDQRDPQRLPLAEEPAGASGRPTAITARRSTTAVR